MRSRDADRVAGGEEIDPARTVIGPHFMKVEPGERILAARNRTSTFGKIVRALGTGAPTRT
jgi:hypothetical protein